jgi:3-hydroxyisobutyrate dehydrogenase
MGDQVFYLGEAGNGCIIKLVNNIIVLCTGQLLQEGIVLAAKAGVDPELLDQVLRASTARPFIGLMPYVLGRRFDNPSFTLALAEKDVRLALESATDLSVPMPLTAAAHQTYRHALDAGLGDKSFIATLQTLETAAHVAVPIRQLDRGRDRL